VSFAPFDALSADVTLRSQRDLLAPERAASRRLEQDALRGARERFAGLDLGWETNRTIATSFAFRPRVTQWLRPSYAFSSRFSTDRNPSYLEIVTTGPDTSALLQRRFLGDRTIMRGFQLEPVGIWDALAGAPDPEATTRPLARRLVAAILPLNAQWSSRLGSHFERETIAPGLGYQLGLGDFAGFRFIGSDTAANARLRDELRLASGLRLPAGAQLDLTYFEAAQDVHDVTGGTRRFDERGWPNVRFAWLSMPLPAPLAPYVRSASLTAGYEHVQRHSTFDAFASQDRGQEETRMPVQLSLTLGGGMTASFNAMWVDGNGIDPTGRTEQRAFTRSAQVGGTLRPPEALRARFQHPINALLAYTAQDQRQCRFRSGVDSDDCVPFLDLGTSTINFTLDTVLSDLTVGVQMSYTGRHNQIGTMAGSNQFQLGLFGQFNFEAGRLPVGGGIR
jgi:hypothetical protein